MEITDDTIISHGRGDQPAGLADMWKQVIEDTIASKMENIFGDDLLCHPYSARQSFPVGPSPASTSRPRRTGNKQRTLCARSPASAGNSHSSDPLCGIGYNIYICTARINSIAATQISLPAITRLGEKHKLSAEKNEKKTGKNRQLSYDCDRSSPDVVS